MPLGPPVTPREKHAAARRDEVLRRYHRLAGALALVAAVIVTAGALLAAVPAAEAAALGFLVAYSVVFVGHLVADVKADAAWCDARRPD